MVFLPAYGRTGAALLRIYNVATALKPLGWRSVVIPPRLTLAQRLRFLDRLQPDVIVMQGVRHDLNRPALYSDWPIVFDMDDADFHLPRFAAPVADAMGQVACVTAGARYLADWCLGAGAPAAKVVWTGTPPSTEVASPAVRRAPVVAWAQTRPMTYTREAAMVAEVMRGLAARRPGVTLRLYDRRAGDDPGFRDLFHAPGLTVEWVESCGYDAYLASFDDVAVGLAPLAPETPFSRGKSFGKVLAYLDRQVPVVGSASGEHGQFFTDKTGVITNDLAAWVDALDRLLGDASERQAMAEAAHGAFLDRLTTRAAAAAMDAVLCACLPRRVAWA
ncbi:MAG: glycosyltransferase [Pseudomonadota bacterium]